MSTLRDILRRFESSAGIPWLIVALAIAVALLEGPVKGLTVFFALGSMLLFVRMTELSTQRRQHQRREARLRERGQSASSSSSSDSPEGA